MRARRSAARSARQRYAAQRGIVQPGRKTAHIRRQFRGHTPVKGQGEQHQWGMGQPGGATEPAVSGLEETLRLRRQRQKAPTLPAHAGSPTWLKATRSDLLR
jgi:hypothetical protein